MDNATPAPILIIEDHPEHLDYLATLLRRAGYGVAAFESAVAGVRYMTRCPVSLVITDVFMPEMDGFEVLKTLRQCHPEVPLIAVSGAASYDRADFLAGMQNLGAQAVFTKPLDAAALLGAVSLLVGAGLGPT
ncbi:MAG: response regulator transcription factor [Stellaceae bacterium]